MVSVQPTVRRIASTTIGTVRNATTRPSSGRAVMSSDSAGNRTHDMNADGEA